MTASAATRKFRRAVRIPEAGVPCGAGCGLSKSAVSRRFKALTQAKFDEWTASDLSELDLVAVQIDGLHLSDRLLMIGAVGIDASGRKRPLGVIEGATENAATVQALLDDLIGRGLDPKGCYLFIVDGARALSKAIRRTFGADIPHMNQTKDNSIRSCPQGLLSSAARFTRAATSPTVSPRNITPACGGRSDKPGNLIDADKAERLMRSMAQRFEQEAPDVSRSILEGLDEVLTVSRLGLPLELRRSPASTNIIESMNSTVRQVCRNVKRWRNAGMALRWTAAGMMEAEKGARHLIVHAVAACRARQSRKSVN